MPKTAFSKSTNQRTGWAVGKEHPSLSPPIEKEISQKWYEIDDTENTKKGIL